MVFDPRRIAYQSLLEVFWESHDPTQGMRQGNDIGTQYRSGLYPCDDLQTGGGGGIPTDLCARPRPAGYGAITTEILDAPVFYYAEHYHQQYLAKNPARLLRAGRHPGALSGERLSTARPVPTSHLWVKRAQPWMRARIRVRELLRDRAGRRGDPARAVAERRIIGGYGVNAEVRTLDRVHPTLPSSFYYDDGHYRTELERIWYRSWLCAGRGEDIPEAGDYRVLEVGSQSVILTRDEDLRLRAFHNTCRHRGSLLCEESHGRFRRRRIVCPYHAWTYSLSGELTATPWRIENGSFDASRFSLYEVAAGEWEGFVFFNLDPHAGAFDSCVLGGIPARFANWRLGETRSARSLTVDLRCNWKIFWENFSECYHCPRGASGAVPHRAGVREGSDHRRLHRRPGGRGFTARRRRGHVERGRQDPPPRGSRD